MKPFITLLFCLFSFSLLAQESHRTKTKFVRIYNQKGKKIQKGNLVYISDSSVILKRESAIYEVFYSEIGLIKTKRSFGHRMGIITGTTAVSFALVGLLSTENRDEGLISSTPEEAALLLGAGGTFYGGIASIIAHLLTKKEVIKINGSLESWMLFKNNHQVLNNKLIKPIPS